jgi:hypothetical protein
MKDATLPDRRHHAIMQDIDRWYRLRNDGLPAPDMPVLAKHLKWWLDRNPNWPLEVCLRCVTNRFGSDCNHSESPYLWIKHLASYRNGSLDRFGRPRTTNIEPTWSRSTPASAASGESITMRWEASRAYRETIRQGKVQ